MGDDTACAGIGKHIISGVRMLLLFLVIAPHHLRDLIITQESISYSILRAHVPCISLSTPQKLVFEYPIFLCKPCVT